jgi:conjugal transfer pilin signal peptidase TrbI
MRTLFLHRKRPGPAIASDQPLLRELPARPSLPARPWILVAILLSGLAVWGQHHYSFGLNASPSLPYRLFLIHKGEMPRRGDFVAFRWAGGGPYPAGVTFIKVLVGVPGDQVSHEPEGFHVNGSPVGAPKRTSRHGEVLAPGPTGCIPNGRYYVQADHPDSLDSRYALTGWIRQSQIIGRARALF